MLGVFGEMIRAMTAGGADASNGFFQLPVFQTPFSPSPAGGGGGVTLGDYVLGGASSMQAIIDRLMALDPQTSSHSPTPQSVLDALRVGVVGEDELEGGMGDDACAVCQDAYHLGQDVLWVPCDHVFHRDCILPWLKSSSTCPICRSHVTLVTTPDQSVHDVPHDVPHDAQDGLYDVGDDDDEDDETDADLYQ